MPVTVLSPPLLPSQLAAADDAERASPTMAAIEVRQKAGRVQPEECAALAESR